MKKLFLNIFLFLAMAVSAQKQELKTLCAKMDALTAGNNPVHIEYTMTMQGRGALTEKESMQISYFKKDANTYKMVMGAEQELIYENKTAFMISHTEKTIMVQEDTSKSATQSLAFLQLGAMADSAASIEVAKEKNETTYLLKFSNDPLYSSMKLKFANKTGLLLFVYCEFRPDYPDPYYSLSLDYQLWDSKWKAEENFPEVEKYVKEKNKKYTTVLEGYQVFQPEKAVVNIGLGN